MKRPREVLRDTPRGLTLDTSGAHVQGCQSLITSAAGGAAEPS
jgi:hypothetical protein